MLNYCEQIAVCYVGCSTSFVLFNQVENVSEKKLCHLFTLIIVRRRQNLIKKVKNF